MVPRILKLPTDVEALGVQTTLSIKGEDSVYVPQPQEIPMRFFVPREIPKRGGKSNQLKYSRVGTYVCHNILYGTLHIAEDLHECFLT